MNKHILNFFAKKPHPANTIVSTDSKKFLIPEDSVLRRHFLTQLRAEIEQKIIPSAADPSLRHYYAATVAAEFQKRLGEMSV